MNDNYAQLEAAVTNIGTPLHVAAIPDVVEGGVVEDGDDNVEYEDSLHLNSALFEHYYFINDTSPHVNTLS